MKDETKLEIIKELSKGNVKIAQLILEVQGDNIFNENKDKENCIRTITKASIDMQDEKIIITFTGDGFLRYQVRNMVGILIRVGEGKLSSTDLKKVLESKDRTKSGKTAPAEGLYLVNVAY